MHPLDGCRAKIERARLHLGEFADRVRNFTDQAPFKVRGEHHPESNEIVFVAEANDACPPIPLDLALIAGEVAHQLRSALDHLVWQLVIAHTGQSPQGTKSGFPIFKTEAGYEQRSGSMILGVSERARERIRAAQPYHLGGDAESALTWVVHQLNNTDKHRLIPVAVEHTSVGSVVMSTDDGVVSEILPWQEHVREPLHDGAEIARVLIPEVNPAPSSISRSGSTLRLSNWAMSGATRRQIDLERQCATSTIWWRASAASSRDGLCSAACSNGRRPWNAADVNFAMVDRS